MIIDKITSTAELKKAVEEVWDEKYSWKKNSELDANACRAIVVEILTLIDSFEAGVRERIDFYNRGIEMVMPPYGVNLTDIRIQELRRLLSGSEIPKKGLEGEKG
jgi:hypothetical protein